MRIMKNLLNDLALIPLFLVIFAVVSPMFTSCSQKGDNLSNENKNENVNKDGQKPVENVYKELNNLPQFAHPAILINNNKSAGVKDANKKKDDAKKVEEEKPEVKTEKKTKDPRMADDSEMDPKNKFPENYNGK